jgi:hypothetical protein
LALFFAAVQISSLTLCYTNDDSDDEDERSWKRQRARDYDGNFSSDYPEDQNESIMNVSAVMTLAEEFVQHGKNVGFIPYMTSGAFLPLQHVNGIEHSIWRMRKSFKRKPLSHCLVDKLMCSQIAGEWHSLLKLNCRCLSPEDCSHGWSMNKSTTKRGQKTKRNQDQSRVS